MKVSIITPSFNSAGTIADTLKSVIGQTYPDIEHIIVDGASRDNTLSLVRKHAVDARIISEPDEGIYDAMNKGISHATGEIIGILNSDDFYAHSDVIQRVADLFARTGCEALYGDLVYVDSKHTDHIVRVWKAGAFEASKFLNGWMPPHPTFFVHKEMYKQHGMYNTTLRSSADYELMLRFLYRHRIPVEYLAERLVCMRTGGHSNVSWRNRIRANKEDRLAWKLNGLSPRFYTTLLKPIRKIPQFI